MSIKVIALSLFFIAVANAGPKQTKTPHSLPDDEEREELSPSQQLAAEVLPRVGSSLGDDVLRERIRNLVRESAPPPRPSRPISEFVVHPLPYQPQHDSDEEFSMYGRKYWGLDKRHANVMRPVAHFLQNGDKAFNEPTTWKGCNCIKAIKEEVKVDGVWYNFHAIVYKKNIRKKDLTPAEQEYMELSGCKPMDAYRKRPRRDDGGPSGGPPTASI